MSHSHSALQIPFCSMANRPGTLGWLMSGAVLLSQADDDTGDFEPVFFLIAIAVALAAGYRYYRSLITVHRLVCPRRLRVFLAIWPIVCLGPIIWVLMNLSDPQYVRGHADYMLAFAGTGLAWILTTPIILSLSGISLRDDAIERRNGAALVAIASMMLGQALCYAGANIGSGATIWTTIVPALLASGVLYLGWFISAALVNAVETVSIDRHVPTAWVLAVLTVLAAADLGWAASGDWNGWQGMFMDFGLRALPAAVLWLGALLTLAWIRPRVDLPGRRTSSTFRQ
jgi:hypothetical protein